MLHAQTLLHALSGLHLAHPIFVYQRIGSTNDEAKRFADSGAPEGLLIVAEEQTAGRGRAGRKWITPPGAALAFSLLLRPDLTADLALRLTMLAGLAVCEAIEGLTPLAPVLKWPNDVLIAEKKIGGILVEAALEGDRLRYAVLGVGLNVSAAPPDSAVDFPATCLQAETGEEVDRLALLKAILLRLQARYPSVGDDSLVEAWRARLMRLDEVVVHTAGGELRGRVQGVDSDGALVLRLESGETLRLVAGEARLRPA